MEKVTSCPLGSKCEEIKDNVIHECAWFVTLKGTHPQTGEEINQKSCAIAWLPLLQIEQAREMRGMAAASESSRNVSALILERLEGEE